MSHRMREGLLELFVRARVTTLLIVVVMVFLAYGLFQYQSVQDYFHGLDEYAYVAVLFAGMLIAVGITAPFGVAILWTVTGDVNLLAAGLVGGVGGGISNYLVFKFVRRVRGERDEDGRYKGHPAYGLYDWLVARRVPPKVAFYTTVGVAGFLIATPLPDEFGVAIMAGLTTVSDRKFALICLALDTVEVIAFLAIGLLL